MTPIEAVRKLSDLGYRFEPAGDRLRYRYEGQGEPDLDTVKPLLGMVKANKHDVLAYLKPTPQERVLTCYECGYYRPANNSLNPSQAWGYCEKRDKGRYGVATACKAILTAAEPHR